MAVTNVCTCHNPSIFFPPGKSRTKAEFCSFFLMLKNNLVNNKFCLNRNNVGEACRRRNEGSMANILVCDDDREIVDAIEIYLSQDGYKIYKAYDGEQAIQILDKEDIHLLIMDIMMPRLDGIRATLKIREYSSIPIIILSAKSEDTDKILGLNIGADDYICKPFNPLELVARVKSNLRRYTSWEVSPVRIKAIYQVGGLILNDDTKQVTVDDEPVKMTPIEYNILLLLMKNQGRVFSINQIYESIWNEDAIRSGQYRGGTHPAHSRENRDQPQGTKVLKSGMGSRL